MKKKLMMGLIVICMAFSFVGVAAAVDISRLPQHMQEYYAEQGIEQVLVIYFPVIPNIGAPWNWNTHIFVSNPFNVPIQIQMSVTAWNEPHTIKFIDLEPYERKVFDVGEDFGFGNVFADAWCSSPNIFGATALMYDSITLSVQTAFPPILLQ